MAETQVEPQGYVEHKDTSRWDNDGNLMPCPDCVQNDLFDLAARAVCLGLALDQLASAGEGAVLELLTALEGLEHGSELVRPRESSVLRERARAILRRWGRA